MLTHMTTGEPVYMPDGLPIRYIQILRELLVDKFCVCGVRGTETSVQAITSTPTGVAVTISCDFCSLVAMGTVEDYEL